MEIPKSIFHKKHVQIGLDIYAKLNLWIYGFIKIASVWNFRQIIEFVELLRLRASQNQNIAWKPATSVFDPTCEAATRVDVNQAKLNSDTNAKGNTAAGIEQSSNEAIEANS